MSLKNLNSLDQILKIVSSKSGRYFFIMTQKLIDLFQTSETLLKPSPDELKLGVLYVFTLKRTKYWIKKLKDNHYVLAKKAAFESSFLSVDNVEDLHQIGKYSVVDFQAKFLDRTKKTSKEIKPRKKSSILKSEEAKVLEVKRDQINEYLERDRFYDWKTYGGEITENDLREKEILLEREFKLKRKAHRSQWRILPHIKSDSSLFSYITLSGSDRESRSEAQLERRLLEAEREDNRRDAEYIEWEKYLKSKYGRKNSGSRYFTTSFPMSQVIELNNSSHFWALISPEYKNVDSFVVHLKEFYGSLSVPELDHLIANIEGKGEKFRVWIELQKKIGALNYRGGQDNTFKKLLDNKLLELKNKNESLSSYLQELKSQLIDENKFPETDFKYLRTVKEKKEILEEIEQTCNVLNTYSDKIEEFSAKHENFIPKFYLSIFGSKAVLYRYDELVCNTLFQLNNQLNEIVFFQREIERVLFEKLSTLHKARKAQIKLDFLSQDDSLSKLVLKKSKFKEILERENRLRGLQIQGSLRLVSSDIQRQIEAEKSKLNTYFKKLNQLDSYPDYEERSEKLRIRKEAFEKRVSQYRKKLYDLKFRAERMEAAYESFMSELNEQIFEFQKEVSQTYKTHIFLMDNSMKEVWTNWAEEGIKYLERILSKKDRLVREFAEIISLRIKNIHLTQSQLLQESRRRQVEWERVYREVVDEFKSLGYYLQKPKPSEYDSKYLSKLDKSSLNLSPEIKSLIYYRPSLKYTTPKVNELIGLSPKILDDSEFLVIDQVWTKLTPEQEYRLKERLSRETKEKNESKLEELLKKSKEEMNERLKKKDFSFKTLNFERDFPKEGDREERLSRLKQFEKAQFHSWKDSNFTSSEMRYKTKEMIYDFSRKLFTLKGVERYGENINISDMGRLENPELIENLSEYDYFSKSSEKLSLVESYLSPRLKIEESDLYDLEDEGYLSILDALEERDEDRRKREGLKKPIMPRIEEWAGLNLKRYREEKKRIDILEVREGLLELEKEIQLLKKSSGDYKKAAELERERREIVFGEMKGSLKELQEYFMQREEELSVIFTKSSEMIDLSFSEIDRRLRERKKRILELKSMQKVS